MRNLIIKSLRLKLFLLFVLLLIGFSSVHLLIRYHWTLPQLMALEVENDKKDIKKLGSAFARIQSEMQRLVYDNAVWDEMTRAIEREDKMFLYENYHIRESLQSLNLNGMHFYDYKGKAISHFALENNGEVISDSLFQVASEQQKAQFLSVQSSEPLEQQKLQFKSGLIRYKEDLILFVSSTIMPSVGTGKVYGNMLVWTYLDYKVSLQLTELMQRHIQLHSYSKIPKDKLIIPFEKYKSYPTIRTQDELVYVSFNDVSGKAQLVMAYIKPKRMFSDQLIETSMGIALISSIFILAFIYYLINRVVISPLSSLRKTVYRVIKEGDFSQETNIKRQDEIGHLAHLIDGLFATVNNQKTVLVEANKQLQKLSDTDELTKIANRRALMSFLDMLSNKREPALFPISMIMLDIDHFKSYNDHYGHQGGDEVICKVAEALAENTRSSMDLVARYGGEEFTILLTQVNAQEAIFVADKLKQAVMELNIPHEKSTTAECLTASLGLTTCNAPDEFDIEQMFRVADSALYEAKDNGRNTLVSKSYKGLDGI